MELFGLIGIKDIIDILIVATLLFYIYKIMKESGTLSIFLGVLAFIIVWFVASVFLKMELTGRILDKFMNIGLLILVILFQDQIKRFLVEIGSHQRWRFVHNLFRRRQTDEKPQASWILPIVYACLNMSKSKTGALIVIKGVVPLDSYEKSGDIIDAEVNGRLIENIFFKNSPLHDGAMIVASGTGSMRTYKGGRMHLACVARFQRAASARTASPLGSRHLAVDRCDGDNRVGGNGQHLGGLWWQTVVAPELYRLGGEN